MVVLDIGCGRKKLAGSIGIDFSEMSDADIVLDLNVGKLPFDNESVDFIHSSHALEHLSVDGFFNVLNECYRVLKPNGQMYVLVPYFSTNLNLANIFHNNQICFNEHTFRFFSSDLDTPALPASEYFYPSCPHWGLRYSANSELNIEFRTERIDFIYMPAYRGLTNDELVSARRSKSDVVEQIAYHLSPVKPCPYRPERGPVGQGEDPHVFISGQLDYLRRQAEHLMRVEAELAERPDQQPNSKINTMILFGKNLASSKLFWELKGELYSSDGLLFPPHDVIRQLDSSIQEIQAIIDDLQILIDRFR